MADIPALIDVAGTILTKVFILFLDMVSVIVSASLPDIIMLLMLVLLAGIVYEIFSKVIKNRFLAFVLALIIFMLLYDSVFGRMQIVSSVFLSMITVGMILVTIFAFLIFFLFRPPSAKKKGGKNDNRED
jgi:uncharacterized membrane protein YccC